jgi:hypothetical protein
MGLSNLHVEVPKFHRISAHKHSSLGGCGAVLAGNHALAYVVHVEAAVKDLPECAGKMIVIMNRWW